MRRMACCLLLLSVGLTHAQDKLATRRSPSESKLHATLLALKDAGASRLSLSHQLVDEIMSLAESDCQPSRPTVASFADDLVNALLGKNITNAEALMLEVSIDAVLRRTGATFASASHIRETLAALGVDASKLQSLTKRFIAIGEEVRGPDDLPVRQKR